jgi:Domain of unknown function (DUF1835)
MEKTLHITNGDSAVAIMKKANITGDFLPWRDVLHDGPVPEALPIKKLSQVRAQFIAECGWGDLKSIENSFTARDTQLTSSNQYQNVILWFEHDLYDQLQIMQVLDWFHQHPVKNETSLSIICTDNYLGMLSTDEMCELFNFELPVTEEMLNLASSSWAAFRSNTPEKLHSLLNSETGALPFLKGAILRLLEEYPSTFNGLSRTAQQVLAIIEKGESSPGKVFGKNQNLEDRIFMGDASFWVILNELLGANPPLLALPDGKKELTLPLEPNQELTITAPGKEVLSGTKNWLNSTRLDRWIGGVHLTSEIIWCWDSRKNSIVDMSL